ncbi:hypothetical protein NVV94_05290 [Pseudomonas sp. LS1212]|uniref:hypothetical protein n=1 Tax=Pseudomonas sp. LS1212 TaxID=2972478 RepID=UPI00215BC1E6|nr:hypothetical protein [Pseudomonas sp. LS1212]UVJ44998.1 hypothetical protein NVV94_05290 [Pseudomonas sp. LS1212]
MIGPAHTPGTVLYAIQELVSNTSDGEIHGNWNTITDRLAVAMHGGLDEPILGLFRQKLRDIGLDTVTAGSSITFSNVNGVLSFADNKVMLTGYWD